MRKLPVLVGMGWTPRTCMSTGTGTGTEGKWSRQANTLCTSTGHSANTHAPPALISTSVPLIGRLQPSGFRPAVRRPSTGHVNGKRGSLRRSIVLRLYLSPAEWDDSLAG